MCQSLEDSQPKCLWCLKEFEPESRLIDLFYQPRVLCLSCHDRLDYQPKEFKLNKIKVQSLYRYDSEFSRLLIQYKENRDIVLSAVFKELIREKKFKDRLVVMPSSIEKVQTRGFHHLLEIFGHDCLNPFIKVSEQKQVGLNKVERSKMRFKLNQEVNGKVILVDDVITTGSTLSEGIRLLRNHCTMSAFVIAYKE